MYGCYEYHNRTVGDRVDKQIDAERGHHTVYANVGTSSAAKTTLSSHQLEQARSIAGFWGYVLQIIYQVRRMSQCQKLHFSLRFFWVQLCSLLHIALFLKQGIWDYFYISDAF